MTPLNTDPQPRPRPVDRLTAATGLASIIAVVALALTGHDTAAAAAGAIGAGVSTTGIRVAVRIRP